jgi:trans-aconitate 2-methyltransferase
VAAGAWNPDQYARFADERGQPFFDLLALVRPAPAMCVVDLGCGTGELTRRLHEALAARETLGIDTSAAMLERSTPFAGGGLRFERRDIATFTDDGSYDLVFSNAALHWLDDHPSLLARLTALVASDGQLAFQVPAQDDHPAYRTAAEVAGESPFREALGGYTHRTTVLPPEAYAALLHRLGYRRQHVRLQVYGHLLAARDEVVEWIAGARLTDYERRLPPDLYATFLDRYRQRLLPRLADERPYFYPFKRLLAWAQR